MKGRKKEGTNDPPPNPQNLDQQTTRKPSGQHLTNNEHITRQCTLQHDQHLEPVVLDGDLDPEALQVDDSGEDDNGGDEVHNVRQPLAPERFSQSPTRVTPSEDEMEQGGDSNLEFSSPSNVNSGRRERFPNNGLADVGSDEEVAGTKVVTFLEKLVKEDDEEGGDDELDDEEADVGAEVFGLAIETGEDIDGGLAQGDDECKGTA